MTIHSPDQPFFLPPRVSENSGVDFLGLRQANLDMMAEMIPSLNNVTDFIRPFSLMAWVFWKFHELCVDAGIDEPSREDIDCFREKIEVLFSWGASLHEISGRIPGTGATPPSPSSDGQLPLSFKDWKRVQSSTSLIAALWYGPASKVVTGLGFLMPLPGRTGFFRVTGVGIHLAKALDSRLCEDQERYERLLATLEPRTASQDDAIALWQIWWPENLTSGECDAFASALYDNNEVGNLKTLLGKRSTTLALAIHHIGNCSSPLSASDVRQGMALSSTPQGSPYTLPERLTETRNNWLTLQMRQLQRLSMECLLSWCEARILDDDIHDTVIMAQNFSDTWDGALHGLEGCETVGAMIGSLADQAGNIEEFIDAVRDGGLANPFQLMATIQSLFRERDSEFAQYAFAGILLCVVFAGVIDEGARLARQGGAQRISLENLRRRMIGLGSASVREAFQYVLEAMIISQHLSIAVNRFDGRNQRLRLTIEETGLEVLVDEPWAPSVTGDRLPTLLSIATQSGLINRAQDGGYLTM